MAKGTLYNKIWNSHKASVLESGERQIFVGRHLMHEVTSPQAFEMLRERGISIRRPELTFAVLDHVIPTDDISRPFEDAKAELMTKTLEDNVAEFGIKYFAPGKGQGVCHVIYPELGIIWPGQVVVCGDSHTSTYGAFGTLAMGIGTTQVSHVLATQTISMSALKVRKINFIGRMNRGVTAKDLALRMIGKLGAKGGVGFAYELAGETVNNMSMEERMTLCNMGIEGGARSCYINPDETTFDYLKGRPYAPDKDFEDAVEYWKAVASDKDADYDDIVDIDVTRINPVITWGVSPDQVMDIAGSLPEPGTPAMESKDEALDAYDYMGLRPGEPIEGTPVDVVFIGSCTNGRLNDLIGAADILKDNKVSVKTLIVPGSEQVKKEAEGLGLDKIFKQSGAQWRNPGCSMCLAMNPDKLVGNQRSVSTSNRNFKGRQGSPAGRTHLASPITAAACAIEGKIINPERYMKNGNNN